MKFKKVVFIVFLIIFNSVIIFAGVSPDLLLPQVDKRTELICIGAKLADIKGVNDNAKKFYLRSINKHFSPYKNHPLIRHLQELMPKSDED